jgi:hypothetical protein
VNLYPAARRQVLGYARLLKGSYAP